MRMHSHLLYGDRCSSLQDTILQMLSQVLSPTYHAVRYRLKEISIKEVISYTKCSPVQRSPFVRRVEWSGYLVADLRIRSVPRGHI